MSVPPDTPLQRSLFEAAEPSFDAAYTGLRRLALDEADLFVLPSLEEGLARVMLEAMGCGLPIVATTNTGATDVVREGVEGFVVPIRDVEALREKIAYLYENPERREAMGRDALARVHAEFTLEKYFERMGRALENIVKTRQPKSH